MPAAGALARRRLRCSMARVSAPRASLEPRREVTASPILSRSSADSGAPAHSRSPASSRSAFLAAAARSFKHSPSAAWRLANVRDARSEALVAPQPATARHNRTSKTRRGDMATPGTGGMRPREPYALRLAAGEVLGCDLVEEVLELLDDLLLVLDVVLELDRRLGDDVLGGEDRGAGAHGQGQGVAGPRVDLELAPVRLQRDRGEERVLAQLGDRDLLAGDVELAEHVAQQVVRHRARRGGALELHEDGRGLGMADPDRQELVAVNGLEQDDRLLADHVEAHAVDDHLLHSVGPFH